MPTISKRTYKTHIRSYALYIIVCVFCMLALFYTRGSFAKLAVLLQKKHDTDIQSELAKDTAMIAMLSAENTTLKEALGRMPENHKGVLAHVATPPNRSIYDTMIVDAGIQQGIASGMTVYALSDVALGKVAAVYDSTAVVELFSISGQKISGSVASSGVSLTLVGRGAGEYEVRMPRDIRFTKGDVITTQTTNTKILAVIESVEADSRDPFVTIRAKAPVNLQMLPWVLIK